MKGDTDPRSAGFADVVVGAAVDVKGILGGDGTVLARQVRIVS